MTRRVARLRAGRGWAGGCAGHASGRPGAAASRSRAFSHLHWPRAVLSPAVVRAGAVRSDRQRRVIFRLPGPGPLRSSSERGSAPRARPRTPAT